MRRSFAPAACDPLARVRNSFASASSRAAHSAARSGAATAMSYGRTGDNHLKPGRERQDNQVIAAASDDLLAEGNAFGIHLAGHGDRGMPGIGVGVALTYRSAVDDPARFISSKRWDRGSVEPVEKPICRARRLGRHHQGWRRQPAPRVVSGRDRHDAPWAFEMAGKMSRAGCPPPWRKARHGRPSTTHRGDPSPDVG